MCAELIGKGRETAEADVENYAQGPDIDGAGVAAVFAVFEELGGNVGGGSASGNSCETMLLCRFIDFHRTYNVVVKDSSPMILASPKSAIFTVNSLSTSRIFSGLISRWTTFRSC